MVAVHIAKLDSKMSLCLIVPRIYNHECFIRIICYILIIVTVSIEGFQYQNKFVIAIFVMVHACIFVSYAQKTHIYVIVAVLNYFYFAAT